MKIARLKTKIEQFAEAIRLRLTRPHVEVRYGKWQHTFDGYFPSKTGREGFGVRLTGRVRPYIGYTFFYTAEAAADYVRIELLHAQYQAERGYLHYND